MSKCPDCNSPRVVQESAYLVFHDDYTVEQCTQFRCLNCNEHFFDYETLEAGTNDETKPSHDNLN